MTTLIRRLVILVVAGLIVTAVVNRPDSPEELFEQAKARLPARVDAYISLRQANDWQTLYTMTDPQERHYVPLNQFLDAYGLGVLKVTDMDQKSLRFNDVTQTATLAFTAHGSLQPEKMPGVFARGFKYGSEGNLSKDLEGSVQWVLRDGEWYFRMDPETVTGRHASGAEVIPLNETAADQAQRDLDASRDP